MAAGIAAGQRLTRWNYERVALKDDEVLIVPASADLLRVQAVLVCFAAAVQLDLARHGVAVAAPCRALALSIVTATNATTAITTRTHRNRWRRITSPAICRFSWLTRMICRTEVIWAEAGVIGQSDASANGISLFIELSSAICCCDFGSSLSTSMVR
jgi:hypothetical protein